MHTNINKIECKAVFFIGYNKYLYLVVLMFINSFTYYLVKLFTFTEMFLVQNLIF